MKLAFTDSDDEIETLWRTNRVRKTKPKPGLGWCMRCDRGVIGVGQRCRVCGFRADTKHQKPN